MESQENGAAAADTHVDQVRPQSSSSAKEVPVLSPPAKPGSDHPSSITGSSPSEALMRSQASSDNGSTRLSPFPSPRHMPLQPNPHSSPPVLPLNRGNGSDAVPSSSAGALENAKEIPTCANCYTQTTPLWRRSHDNSSILCNACALFFKVKGRPRPVSLKSDVIKSRNRRGKKSVSRERPSSLTRAGPDTSHDAESTSSESPELKPRGRGRPRKNPVEPRASSRTPAPHDSDGESFDNDRTGRSVLRVQQGGFGPIRSRSSQPVPTSAYSHIRGSSIEPRASSIERGSLSMSKDREARYVAAATAEAQRRMSSPMRTQSPARAPAYDSDAERGRGRQKSVNDPIYYGPGPYRMSMPPTTRAPRPPLDADPEGPQPYGAYPPDYYYDRPPRPMRSSSPYMYRPDAYPAPPPPPPHRPPPPRYAGPYYEDEEPWDPRMYRPPIPPPPPRSRSRDTVMRSPPLSDAAPARASPPFALSNVREEVEDVPEEPLPYAYYRPPPPPPDAYDYPVYDWSHVRRGRRPDYDDYDARGRSTSRGVPYYIPSRTSSVRGASRGQASEASYYREARPGSSSKADASFDNMSPDELRKHVQELTLLNGSLQHRLSALEEAR